MEFNMLKTISLGNILQNMLTKIKTNTKERQNMIEIYRMKGIRICTRT